jgi:uncharacterized protein YbjT (DUF2867 family)
MVVIFGAAGNVGRATVAALRQAGQGVRAVVRDPARARTLVRMGCDVAVADLDDDAAVRRALEGAHAAQVLCPVPYRHPDPAAAMRRTIATVARALDGHSRLHVVALSDYGAELDAGTGITLLYRDFEAALAQVVPRLTVLRSAEHMQNWGRAIPVPLETGRLPTFHDAGKSFPMVAAEDVGILASQLLLQERRHEGVTVVSVEGPRRYGVADVAGILGEIGGRDIVPHAVPRADWPAALARAGMSPAMADLLGATYDASNEGRIDAQPGTLRRFGTTGLRDVLAALVKPALAQE